MTWIVTLYRDDSTTPVVFEGVKHVFWTADNSVLVIAQYTNPAGQTSPGEWVQDAEHHYVHWPRERFCWYRVSRS